MGDLSENAEYHMAKQRQEFVRARWADEEAHGRAVAHEPVQHSPRPGRAGLHRGGLSTPPRSEEIEYKLVTSEERDVTKGLISTTSPIGRALMGKKVGDTATVVTPTATVSWRC